MLHISKTVKKTLPHSGRTLMRICIIIQKFGSVSQTAIISSGVTFYMTLGSNKQVSSDLRFFECCTPPLTSPSKLAVFGILPFWRCFCTSQKCQNLKKIQLGAHAQGGYQKSKISKSVRTCLDGPKLIQKVTLGVIGPVRGTKKKISAVFTVKMQFLQFPPFPCTCTGKQMELQKLHFNRKNG